MNIKVPSMAPGDGSLPADLRAGRAGYYSTGRNRLLMGQRGTGMSVEPVYAMSGMGEIMRGIYVVPQNPIVMPNSNPVAVRVNTGGSGIGRLRRIAALQGIRGLGDVCDPTDPEYDPTDPSCTGADLSSGFFGSDPNAAPVLAIPQGNAAVPIESTLPSSLPPMIVGQGTDSFGNLSLTTSNGNTLTYPPGSSIVGSGSNLSVVVPSLGIPAGVAQVPAGYSGPAVVQGSGSTPAAPAGYQWAQVTNQAGQTLAQVLAVAQGGASITLPNGNKLIYGSAASAATAGTATALANTIMSPSVLLMLGGVLVVMLMMRGR